MSSRRVAGTVCRAALFVGLVLAACKSDEVKQDKLSATASTSNSPATTEGRDGAAPEASAPSLPPTVSADASAPAGGCKRLKPGSRDPMCNLARDYCCENIASGEAKCVPHREAKGLQCGDDGAWRVAIGCTTSSMCGPAQKCCIQEPVAGFLQTVCAASCQHEEVCLPDVPGGGCRDTESFECVASPTSRTGARCLLKGAGAGAAAKEGGDAECRRTGGTSCGPGMVCITRDVSNWRPDGSNMFACVKKQ